MNDKSKNAVLPDESLETVSGGTFSGLENCAETGHVEHIYQVGDVVYVKCLGVSAVRCRITELGVDSDNQVTSEGTVQRVLVDTYYCEKLEPNLLFTNGWKNRSQIVAVQC